MTQRRNRLLVRVLRLALVLHGSAVRPTADRLAADFGVTTRTIRRDLSALREAGWHVPPSAWDLEQR